MPKCPKCQVEGIIESYVVKCPECGQILGHFDGEDIILKV